MIPASWPNWRDYFAANDGALVDLIAPDANAIAWEAFWTAMKSGPFKVQAYRNGEPIPPPESVAWIMAERAVASVRVSISVGVITVNCHFVTKIVEMDIDPKEVTGEDSFKSVLDLMRFVANVIESPLTAVLEGGRQEHAFLRVFPDGQAWFLGEASNV